MIECYDYSIKIQVQLILFIKVSFLNICTIIKLMNKCPYKSNITITIRKLSDLPGLYAENIPRRKNQATSFNLYSKLKGVA